MTMWYLWPVDNHPATNEYLAKGIGEQHPECERKDVPCADGRKRNLFICPRGYDDVRTTIVAIPQFGLHIEVFREDIEDVVVRYGLWKQSVQKAARATMRMRSLQSNR